MNEYTAIENALIEKITNKDLRDSLVQIRKSVEAIWSNEAPRIVQGFTDHGLDHCLRLIDYASQLLNANNGNSLSDEEMYLLIAGIYLHDIGMQCDVIKFKGIKDKAIKFGADFKIEFTSTNANQYSLPEQKEIRKNHQYLTAAWIDYAFHNNGTALDNSINTIDINLMQDLIDICMFHSSLDISKCSLKLKISQGRKQLVASLVRFADELDIAKNRVSIETARNFSIDPFNAFFWYLHNSTTIEIIDSNLNFKIVLNPIDFESFGEYVRKTYIDEFRKKNNTIIDILNNNNIPISISSDSKVIVYEYAPKLPDEIINAIKEMQAKDNAETVTSIIDMKQLPKNQLNDYPKSKPYFAGRKAELKELNEVYETSPFIFIEGAGGIGKTQLVAKFIDGLSVKDKIVWYDCIPTSQPDDLIKGAGFEELLKGKEKTEREKFSAFKDKIEEYDLVVFLDNYQEVENKPSFKSFLTFINEYLNKGHLVVIGRDNIVSPHIQPKKIKLKGLGEDSLLHAQKLIEYSYPNLTHTSTKDLEIICESIKGYPLAIDLAIYLLSLNVSAQNIIDFSGKGSMDEGSDIEKISNRLLNKIFTRPDASEDERIFLKIFSVFRGKIKDEDVKSVIPNGIFESASQKLIDRNLLKLKNGYFELHPLVREFCYKKLENKKELHYKVAEIFIKKRENNWILELEERIFYHLKSAEQWKYIANTIMQSGKKIMFCGYIDLLEKMITTVKNQNIFELKFDIYEGDIAQIKGNLDRATLFFEKAKQSTNDEVRIEGTIKYGEILYRQGYSKEAKALFEDVIKNTRNGDYKKWHARALNDLGLVSGFWGNFKEALIKLEAALKIRQELGDLEGIASSLYNIGTIKSVLGFKNEALDLYEKSLKINEEIGDKYSVADSLSNIGKIKSNLGLKNEALYFFEKSLKIREEIGDKSGFVSSLNNIGSIKNDLGLKKEALDLYEKSLKISKEIGDKYSVADSLSNIGSIKDALGIKKEALDLYERSLKIRKEIGDKSGIANNLNNIGSIKDNLGFKKEALDLYEESLKINEEIGNKFGLESSLNNFRLYDVQINDSAFITDKVELVKGENYSKDNYFSLIIGNNGTGKSRVLSSIARYFVEVLKEKKKRTLIRSDFNYNRFPAKIISLTNSISDKFPVDESYRQSSIINKNIYYRDFKYNYLGTRNRINSFSNKALMNRALDILFENYIEYDVSKNYRHVFKYLDYEPVIKLDYKISSKLFNLNKVKITPNILLEFLDKQSDSIRPRKKSIERIEEFGQNRIYEICDFINSHRFREKEILINFSEKNISRIEKDKSKYFDNVQAYSLLGILTKLKIVKGFEIKVYKKGGFEFNFNEASSGEANILSTLIALIPLLQDNSLILIDEPEISLHPLWQSQYVSLLNKIFSNFNGCHIIIASHSHLLAADLPPNNSSVTTLRNKKGNIVAELMEEPIYGSSAEDILLNVFGLPTTRNFNFSLLITNALELLADDKHSVSEFKKAKEKINTYYPLLKDSDPLKKVAKLILQEHTNE
ncbi:MAG: tetratricopeptide repeat protein [Bacteroidales bacterium]|nr:tetratricopeptide repeat protein [Bacteroidales bacterium]